MDLMTLKCEACRDGAPPLKGEVGYVDNWELYDNDTKIRKDFKLPNFKSAIAFINKIAELAEGQGHHPNIYLYDWNQVRVELYTHKIQALHQNDFILATKIDHMK